MVVILFFWLSLVIAGTSICRANIRPIGTEQAIALRGICAIEIMIGHIGLATESMVLYPNRKAGILFVGIFFLLSGYGLASSVEHKVDYLQSFLVKRIFKLMLPAYLVYAMYELFCWCVLGNVRVFAVIDIRNFFQSLNWYVWEQLFFYVVFWMAYRVLPKYKEIVIVIVSLGLIILAFMTKLDNPWYGSTMCFPLGVYYYKLEKSGIKVAGKWKVIASGILSAILILSMFAFLVLGNESVLGNPIARNVASMCFCMLVLIALRKVKIGNAFLNICGKCSYEIFLIHPFVIGLLQDRLGGSLVFAILTIVITFLTAFFLHKIISGMNFR